MKDYIYPVSTMAGSIIGVGIFSLPYVALKAGIWLTLFYFLVLTFIVVIIHLVFAEISLKTPDFKRFPGFVGHHLGKGAGFLALVLTVFGSMGVLLAYLIAASQFLGNILYLYIYFVLAAAAIWFGIKIICKIELAILAFLFFAFLLIFISAFNNFNFKNIFVLNSGFSASDFFIPFGALLFALWGTGMIPQVEEMLGGSVKKKKNLKKIIIISTLIPAIIYLFFIILILGISGQSTTESALTGLKNFVPATIFLIALFAGTLATFNAFVTQGLVLKDILIFDAGIKKWPAFVIACFTPLVLFLLGLKFFIGIVSFIGGVLLALNGVLILLMYKKIKSSRK